MKAPVLKLMRVALLLGVAGLEFLASGDALDNWTSAQFNPNSFFLNGVAFGDGRYVAVGQQNGTLDYGVILTSVDGLNWILQKSGSANGFPLELHSVTYANGTFVAVGWDWYSGTNLYHSTNGIDWIGHTSAIGSFSGVTYGAGLFVAVGDGLVVGSSASTNRQIYTSPDGSTWTARNSGAPTNDVKWIRDVAYGAGRFVAVDDYGYFYTSTLGTVWSRSMPLSPSLPARNGVSFCNDRFIAIVAGTNYVSTDGLSWSVMVKNTPTILGRVKFKDGLYAAISDTAVLTSANSTNWVQRNLQLSANGLLKDIALGDSKVVVVGHTNFPFSIRYAVAYASDPFVAVDINHGFPPRLKLSGVIGRTYRIEYLPGALGGGSNQWQTLTTLSLTNSPLTWPDLSATNSSRFYRAVLLP